MSVRSRVKPARCAAASAALEPDVPLPKGKGKGTARACGRRSRALPRLRESVNREFNIMTNKSSIHFAKCRPGGQPERHNFRQYSTDDFRPSYFLDPADQQPNTYKDLLEPDNSKADAAEAERHARGFFDDLKAQYSGRGKRPKYDNCRREAILNLSEDSTEEDVKKVVDYLKDRWHLTCTSYAIHRDEGYKDQDGVHRNLHAHLVLDSLYLDEKTRKPKQAWREIKIGDLRTIQDDIAKIMRMERTRGHGRARAHLDRETYATVKAAQDRAAQATKAAALETEKAAKAKAEAEKQAEETARQRQQIDHDIEVHRLTPSGILVNRALRDANAAQAGIIDKLNQQAKWTAAKHKSDLADKDRQITEARAETDDKRQTIRQLRAQVAEQQQTINDQAETIKKQNSLISAYEYFANMMFDTLSIYRRGALDKVAKAAEAVWTKAVQEAGEIGNALYSVWEWTTKHKDREAAERLEREKAARLEAERQRQEAEARKSQSRGYVR